LEKEDKDRAKERRRGMEGIPRREDKTKKEMGRNVKGGEKGI
jgi:hypothetical protein